MLVYGRPVRGWRAVLSQSCTLWVKSAVVMPPWVAATISSMPRWPLLANAARSPSSTALNGWRLRHSGWDGARACTRSSENCSSKYMGCSLHSVPSLSNTAMRSSGATKSGLPGVATACTNSTMALREGPSFQDGSAACGRDCGSVAAQPASRPSASSQVQAVRRRRL